MWSMKPIMWQERSWVSVKHIVFSWIFGKRHSGYSEYSKKHQIPRETSFIYSIKLFSTEIRSPTKKFMVKKLLQKSIVLKVMVKKLLQKSIVLKVCLSSFQNQHSGKQQNLSYLSHKEKSNSLMFQKIPFHVR